MLVQLFSSFSKFDLSKKSLSSLPCLLKFFPSQPVEEKDRGPGSLTLSAFDGREQINQAGTTEA